jgi:hypothetical protein
MKQTRSVEDGYTSIKVPESLRRQLRILAAAEDRFIYQVIASMVLRKFEDFSNDLSEKQ